MKNKRLNRSFFERPTLDVAKDLLGKFLIKDNFVAQITEVEAYIGKIDPAAHSYNGVTKRTEVMFGPGGYSYVYFIYGMYFCLNVVTEKKGNGSAVLIRGVKLLNDSKNSLQINGPGKLCRELSISHEHNGIDLCSSKSLWLEDRGFRVERIETSKRIGINKGKNLEWRFFLTPNC